MDLYLIRHPAVAIAPGICYGSSNVDLLERPDVGAARIAEKLAGLIGQCDVASDGDKSTTDTSAILHLSTSPLIRCATVAGMLLKQPVVDERLAELDFGRWEGLAWNAIPREEIDAWAADLLHGRPHGGESVHMLAARTASWLAEWHTGAADTTDRPHVVISHAGVIRVMTAQVLQLPPLTCINWPIAMTGICHLTRINAQAPWTLARWNI